MNTHADQEIARDLLGPRRRVVEDVAGEELVEDVRRQAARRNRRRATPRTCSATDRSARRSGACAPTRRGPVRRRAARFAVVVLLFIFRNILHARRPQKLRPSHRVGRSPDSPRAIPTLARRVPCHGLAFAASAKTATFDHLVSGTQPCYSRTRDRARSAHRSLATGSHGYLIAWILSQSALL